MPARAEVELDIFSGMPNPTWVLTPAEAERLALGLAALPRISACELSPRLGYRGLVVNVTHGNETRLVRVQSGCVQIAEGDTTIHARDERRELERWLIETGRPRLTENVIDVVDREMRRSAP
jgi:hypothetical protein